MCRALPDRGEGERLAAAEPLTDHHAHVMMVATPSELAETSTTLPNLFTEPRLAAGEGNWFREIKTFGRRPLQGERGRHASESRDVGRVVTRGLAARLRAVRISPAPRAAGDCCAIAPLRSAARSQPRAVVRRRIRLFLDARVHVDHFIDQASHEQPAQQKICGDYCDDDIRGAGQVRKIDDHRKPKRDDDSNDPIFRSDIPVHSVLNPLCERGATL